MRYHVTVSGIQHEVEIDRGRVVSLDGQPVQATLEGTDESPVHTFRLEGAVIPIVGEPWGKNCWRIGLPHGTVLVEAMDDRAKTIGQLVGPTAGPEREAHIRAPMPGLVIHVAVSKGETVRPGQSIAIVEAMKMENELTAEVEGRVTSVSVVAGDTVEKNQILVELDTEHHGVGHDG